MLRICREAVLPESVFSITDGFVVTIKRNTWEVTWEVKRLLMVLKGDMKRTKIQEILNIRHEENFRDAYLVPALRAGCIEMTFLDKHKSSKQKYRLTGQDFAF